MLKKHIEQMLQSFVVRLEKLWNYTSRSIDDKSIGKLKVMDTVADERNSVAQCQLFQELSSVNSCSPERPPSSRRMGLTSIPIRISRHSAQTNPRIAIRMELVASVQTAVMHTYVRQSSRLS